MDPKTELLRVLQAARAVILRKVDGLGEYDVRRPLTPTGTNLLGLVKHLAGLEYGYLGDTFGRTAYERPSWFRDDPYAEIDLWATPDESREYVVGVYRSACAHADRTVHELELDSRGYVAHWGRETTLGVLLIRMVAETAQHAGHADILREQLDGRIGSGSDTVAADAQFWNARRAQVQEAADHFRS